MKIKSKIQNLVSPLYNKVWHGPKGRLTAKIKKACDDLPRKQRLTVVTVLLSAFVLTAFLVFGNACYKMGARQAQSQIKIGHIESIPMPYKTEILPDEDIIKSKMATYDAIESEMNVEPLDSVPYEAD